MQDKLTMADIFSSEVTIFERITLTSALSLMADNILDLNMTELMWGLVYNGLCSFVFIFIKCFIFLYSNVSFKYDVVLVLHS